MDWDLLRGAVRRSIKSGVYPPSFYKASKIWNKLPSSLKEFFSVKHFSSKLKEFLQVAEIDSIIECMIMVVFGCFLLYRFDLQFVIRFV